MNLSTWRIADWVIIFVAAGLEEISARLNLMVKAELAELVAGAPMNPGDPETRCQYLEKLLGKQNFKTSVCGYKSLRRRLLDVTTCECWSSLFSKRLIYV